MTEELVTLETAKLLREKGMFTDIEFPPQSVAQKWLRETKNIHICVYNCACGYGYEISKADNGTHITSSVYEGTNDEGKWDEDVQKAGELNLFYDTPQLLFNVKDWTSYWGNARKIAHIPSYMYPQIKDKECYVFNNLELYQSFN